MRAQSTMTGREPELLMPQSRTVEEDLRQIRALAFWLDRAIKIPGTNWSVGFDGLVGLIPGVGDLATTGLSAYVMYLAHQHGVSRWAMLKMLRNVLIDLGVGIIPVVGDVADMAWKSNVKNLRLLERHLLEKYPHLNRVRESR